MGKLFDFFLDILAEKVSKYIRERGLLYAILKKLFIIFIWALIIAMAMPALLKYQKNIKQEKVNEEHITNQRRLRQFP